MVILVAPFYEDIASFVEFISCLDSISHYNARVLFSGNEYFCIVAVYEFEHASCPNGY